MHVSRKRSRSHPDAKNSTGRQRKRYFRGNRYASGDDSGASRQAHQRSVENPRRPLTATAKKVFTEKEVASEISYRLIDFSLLTANLKEKLRCKCGGEVEFEEEDVRGLGFKLKINCNKCSEISSIPSSRQITDKQNVYEVNRRSVLAMRMIGKGARGLQTFCGVMDLPTPITQTTYDIINKKLAEVCQSVAEESMNQAVIEEKDLTSTAGLTVSGDGTWRTPGFASLQGVSTLIGEKTGKTLDISIKNSFCKACDTWQKKLDSAAYDEWFEKHKTDCAINHEGSAGAMEVNGIVEMFANARTKYGVSYSNYVGDGDSKVFKKLLESDVNINKKEDINHVGKRMGTRLRNKKKEFGKSLLEDGKTIGGRGRLTAGLIDDLTKYYAKAIRDHSDSVSDMKTAIWATFYHKVSSDQNPQHHLCPPGVNSWCKWQQTKVHNREFKHKTSVPKVVMDVIKPIYEDLTNESLLSRCLGAHSQNSNECLNSFIWKLVPKKEFSGIEVLKIGAYIAVSLFNDGTGALLKIMRLFEINPGASAVQYTEACNERRYYFSYKRAEGSSKEARTSRLRLRHEATDNSYAAGAF